MMLLQSYLDADDMHDCFMFSCWVRDLSIFPERDSILKVVRYPLPFISFSNIKSLLALSLWFVVITGIPQAFASITTIPNPSLSDGRTNTLLDLIRAKTSSCF